MALIGIDHLQLAMPAGEEVVEGEPLNGDSHVYVDDPFSNRLELLEKA